MKCDGVTCSEMKEERAWREQIDYHGLAAVSYCLLFQTYMETVKVGITRYHSVIYSPMRERIINFDLLQW